MELPYENYNDKLGIKIKFLISDRHKHFNSLCLISYNAINKRLNSKTCPEKELRRASLGNDALVLFASLSQDWKDSLTVTFGHPQQEIKKGYFADRYFSDGIAKDFYLKHEYGEDNKKLRLEYVELYTYNASVLNTVLTVKMNRKEYIKSLGVTSIDIWDSLSRDVNAFRDVPHNLPVNRDALRRKVTQYQREGYVSIISGKHTTKNAIKVSTKEQLALLEKLLRQHQNLNNEQVADLYNIVAKAMIDTVWKTIDATTVANHRKKLGLYVYGGQQGETAFMHNKMMQVKRTAPSVPMVYWTLDGNVTELLYQQKTTNKKGHSVTTYHNRLTTVMVLDPFNKYIIGYAIGTDETPQLIKEALRNAVNHSAELFGERYKPMQLQSDRYQIKNLTPTYEAMSKFLVPAKAHNSKSKIIEPFFDKFNEKHFQAKLAPNWSGHNVNAKKENQPNSDWLNKIRHQFPDEAGCRLQIINAIENDRAEKINAYKTNWLRLPEADRLPLATMDYLRWFGEHTGYTNRLQGQGVTPTILGESRFYDTFDLNFRKYAHLDWLIRYDPQDLTQVLVTNAKSKDGRLQEEIGTHQFLLTDKYIQPMALYDRKEGDSEQLHKIFDYNKSLVNHVIQQNVETDGLLEDLRQRNPQLELLSKLMISDSNGQHKQQKQATKKISAPKKEKVPVLEYADYEIIDNPRYNY
ncbi:hypothetical protein [Flavobacterium psychrophilum]|uniref:hypothetical protein n=3 Tax=Flavobacterium psychrophilum TaxID=96345 RepID=UPI000B7C0DB9|nr:hypothetical protein [Flavobacterium psychrophilum]MEB3380303.1 hypothetical protein [Flavobacterium psychrophilum]SNA72878.1 conserved hypothetical protein [Flavobacterium psychrophilum]